MDMRKLPPSMVRGVVCIMELLPDHFRPDDVSCANGEVIPKASPVLLAALAEARLMLVQAAASQEDSQGGSGSTAPDSKGDSSRAAPLPIATPAVPPGAVPTMAVHPIVNVCCICLDKPADTMAWPCEHVVVCRSCSTKLRSTNDAHVCVHCRRPIQRVLE